METIKKNQTAKVKTKTGNNYSYQYVDIAQIHDYLESIGAKYIQSIQRINDDDYVMTKRCFNDKWEDEWIQGARVVDATLMGVNNPAQQQGSALTYARRYSLLMAFGLATEDDDAQSLSTPIEITQEDADNYVLGFGKHKGKHLKEIPQEYIEWLLGNSNDKYLQKLIELELGITLPSEEEQVKKLKLLAELNEKIINDELDREEVLDNYCKTRTKDLTIQELEEVLNVR